MYEIRVRVGVCARARVCTCKVCVYSMYTERRTRMVRPSNNNPMLMSGGSSFSRLTLRSRLFPMPERHELSACSMAGGCIFRTCPVNFMGNWFALSRLQMIRLFLSFRFSPPLSVEKRSFRRWSREGR